ncbi:L-fucose isomerase [Klebsiella pneumoniae IS39]|nr:L-fucose isomerase [Klebsiella pneumoniae IS39]
MKPHWEIEQSEADACLAATRMVPGDPRIPSAAAASLPAS